MLLKDVFRPVNVGNHLKLQAFLSNYEVVHQYACVLKLWLS